MVCSKSRLDWLFFDMSNERIVIDQYRNCPLFYTVLYNTKYRKSFVPRQKTMSDSGWLATSSCPQVQTPPPSCWWSRRGAMRMPPWMRATSRVVSYIPLVVSHWWSGVVVEDQQRQPEHWDCYGKRVGALILCHTSTGIPGETYGNSSRKHSHLISLSVQRSTVSGHVHHHHLYVHKRECVLHGGMWRRKFCSHVIRSFSSHFIILVRIISKQMKQGTVKPRIAAA